MNTTKNAIVSKMLGVIRFMFLKIRFSKRLTSNGLSIIGKSAFFYINRGGSISIGKKVIISEYCEIQSSGALKLGDRVYLNRNSRIIAFDKIEIGSDVTIAQFVAILDHDHKFEMKEGRLNLDGYTSDPVVIGNNVWIGDKCSILKGSKIGSNVVVAAHTLVNGIVPSNCIVAGVPFKVIKRLGA